MTTVTKDVAPARKTLAELLNDEATKATFAAMLGKDARSFAQNILTVYNGSKSLQQCDPESIVAACGISASINLSILPSLGQSCVVPYKIDGRLVASWQIQWKGLVQLAHRTGQYKRLNLAHVYEGQLVKHDEFKGIVHLDAEAKKSNRVQGYYFFFELLNGTQMEFYWSAKKCIEHGLRYSKSFQAGDGLWTDDPEFASAGSVKKWLALKEQFLTDGSGADSMAGKTVVKNMLNKWGVLETRIKEIVALDQAVIGADGEPRYIDTTSEPASDPKVYTAPTSGEKSYAEKLAALAAKLEKKGVSSEAFAAYLASLPDQHEEAVLATMAAAFERVTKGKEAADKVFSVAAPSAAPRVVTFKVGGVADSEFEGDPATCIRSTEEPPVKRFTDVPAVVASAKAAQKAGAEFKAYAIEKKSGGKSFDWLTEVAAA